MSSPTSTLTAASSPASAGSPTTNNQADNTASTTSAPAPAAPAKRPSRRRAPTAERRASHNAVERARRETLNGRFLTLASLLPPLRVMRRPSKSAIVNSSIATVHAARRHRVLAAQTLKGMMREAEALRREVNEWRTRARIPTLDPPMRSEADAHALDVVLRGEVEELDVDLVDGDDLGGEEDAIEEGEEQEGDGEGDQEEFEAPVPVKEEMKPMTINTNTSQGRFAYDLGAAMVVSPTGMSASPPATAHAMPSPGGSDGSWEGPRTPPTPRVPMAPMGRYRSNSQAQAFYAQAPQPQSKPVGAGAAYDLGLGLFDAPAPVVLQHQVVPPMQMDVGLMYQDEYMAAAQAQTQFAMPLASPMAFANANANYGMGMNAGNGGWASVNPAHPAYHGHAQQQIQLDAYGLPAGRAVGVAPGQYLHGMSAF